MPDTGLQVNYYETCCKEQEATVRTLGYVFGVGSAPLVIIEVQHEADAGYLTHLCPQPVPT